jgi:hypothetical protein
VCLATAGVDPVDPQRLLQENLAGASPHARLGSGQTPTVHRRKPAALVEVEEVFIVPKAKALFAPVECLRVKLLVTSL